MLSGIIGAMAGGQAGKFGAKRENYQKAGDS